MPPVPDGPSCHPTDHPLQERRLKDLIKKHSEFISYPISLWTEKTVEKVGRQQKLCKQKSVCASTLATHTAARARGAAFSTVAASGMALTLHGCLQLFTGAVSLPPAAGGV